MGNAPISRASVGTYHGQAAVLDFSLAHKEETSVGFREPQRVKTNICSSFDHLGIVVVGVVALPVVGRWDGREDGRLGRGLAAARGSKGACAGREESDDGGDGKLH